MAQENVIYNVVLEHPDGTELIGTYDTLQEAINKITDLKQEDRSKVYSIEPIEPPKDTDILSDY
jgi:hypothetical protein